ncbi:MAG: TVP38/TMEM64 family protein [archaeon]
MKKQLIKFILLLGFLILLFNLLYLVDYSLFKDVEALKTYVLSFGIFAPISLILLYALAMVFLIPGTPFNLVAGYLFGPYIGTLYALIGAMLGVSAAFFIAKYMASDFIEKLLEKQTKKLNKYNKKLEKKGFQVLLILRLLSVIHFSGLSYLAGMTKMKYRDFFLATLIGSFPATFILVSVGHAAQNIFSARFIFFILLFALMVMITFYYKKKLD